MERADLDRRIRLAAIIWIVSFAAWGCAAGPAPPDHFYRLTVGNPSSRAARSLPGTLHVDRMRSDAIGGERHILYRNSDEPSEIRRHSYHRWSDPPPILIQTALISYLRSARAADTVMPATARFPADFVLSGRIHHFEQVTGPDPRVVVELDFSLVDSSGEILIHEIYREEREVAGSEVYASVEALSAALHAIFDRFLADLE